MYFYIYFFICVFSFSGEPFLYKPRCRALSNRFGDIRASWYPKVLYGKVFSWSSWLNLPLSSATVPLYTHLGKRYNVYNYQQRLILFELLMISSILIMLYCSIISFRWSENVFRPRQFCCSLILEKIFVTSMFVAILSSSDAIGLRVPNGLGSFILGWKRVQGKFSVGGFHLDYYVF